MDGGFNPWKAGMEGTDQAKINQLIYESSKNSKYFLNEQKKNARLGKKVTELLNKKKAFENHDLAWEKSQVDLLVKAFEEEAKEDTCVVHIDMDAFFAAVETIENPNLKGRPMAVAGSSVLATANYEARKFGVRSAMPEFIARKLCPELIVVPSNPEKYQEVSLKIRALLEV